MRSISPLFLIRLHLLAGALGLALLVGGVTACRPSAGRSQAVSTTEVYDLQGSETDPFTRSPVAHAIVLVFIANECPVANRSVPELCRLRDKFEPQGIRFWFIHPDPDETAEAVREHALAYGLGTSVLRDPNQTLVVRSHVTTTPEAAVFGGENQLIYHGRIDDRFPDFGKERAQPTRRDLELVLEGYLRGESAVFSNTVAIGCAIPPRTPRK